MNKRLFIQFIYKRGRVMEVRVMLVILVDFGEKAKSTAAPHASHSRRMMVRSPRHPPATSTPRATPPAAVAPWR